MALFRKNGAISAADAISSVIGKEMTIIGDVSFEGKVRIDGNVEGNVMGDYLVLSNSGNINGDIEAKVLVCHGRVDGNVKVEQLFLKKDGTINGRLETRDLSVESGGLLNGEIKAHDKDLKLLENDRQDSSSPSSAKEWEKEIQSLPQG
jgi:cytoskeletal protein CcmA (bactofilin family)